MTKTRSAVPWVPPSDWIEFLAAPKTTKLSEMTDSPDLRCLRFILYILGCPSNGRRPYDEFLKAKTIKQKRAWLYKYHGPKFKPPANYVEPIPPIRMARLKMCFPSKFITIGSQTFLDSRLVVKDEAQQIYYAEQH
ncbi:unnamed protein product [Nesidiocoris tenuis]|uniref:Uncharacterized protein n=1 Tax=Nesidiocoris tenuis TaxID=355587 RepID=A0A6H5H236_9HEMI|nr:unnamed protein product [Nesidiocoris tenuis]